MKKIFIILLVYFTTLLISNAGYTKSANFEIKEWNISGETAVKKYFPKREYIKLSEDEMKEYQNLILNRFLSLNSSLINKVTILRCNSESLLDLLLINNKLYSIMIKQQALQQNELSNIIKKLSNRFGSPKLKNDHTFSYYNFTGKTTDVILITQKKSQKFEITLYYYNHNWVKNLILEDF